MRQAVRKSVSFVFCQMVRAYYYLKDLLEIWSFKPIKPHIVAKAPLSSPLESQNPRVAIYATFGAKKKEAFVKYHIKLLKKYCDFVLVCNNCPQFTEENFFSDDTADVVINRQNSARDIGAYQEGYKYISSAKPNVTDVLFMNDSIVVTNEELFNEFCRSQNKGYLGSTYSFQQGIHGQSFLWRVTADIFFNKKFSEFWSKIRPANSRFYAVNRGERGIYKTVEKCTTSTNFLYDYDLVWELLKGRNPLISSGLVRNHIERYLEKSLQITSSNPPTIAATNHPSVHKEHAANSRTHKDITEINRYCFLERLSNELDHYALAYEFGLALASNNKIPFIKLELVSKGLADYTQYKAFIEKSLPSEVANTVMNRIRGLGTPRNASTGKKIKMMTGAA